MTPGERFENAGLLCENLAHALPSESEDFKNIDETDLLVLAWTVYKMPEASVRGYLTFLKERYAKRSTAIFIDDVKLYKVLEQTITKLESHSQS